MTALEILVIATIIIVGAWVGYHAWQDSIRENAESHNIRIDHLIFEKLVQNHKQNYADLGMPPKLNLH